VSGLGLDKNIPNERLIMPIKAIVQKIIEKGKHGAYFVATSEGIEGSVTCSLEPRVWLEDSRPEPGNVVNLEKLRKKRAGWRATAGKFWKPSDEQTQQSANTAKSNEMTATNKEQKPFTPFLVEGGYKRENIFRVMEITGKASREQISGVLANLPIAFQLRSQEHTIHGEQLNEPLEFYINGGIAEIYPPRHRVFTSVMLASWDFPQVHAHDLMCITRPGNGQIRSCFHFFPKDLGVENWEETAEVELEVGINSWPRTKTEELQMPELTFGKSQVQSLVKLISGGGDLTAEQFGKWRELIRYATQSMRSHYEHPEVDENYGVRKYYAPYWVRLDRAENDQETAKILNELCSSIAWE